MNRSVDSFRDRLLISSLNGLAFAVRHFAKKDWLDTDTWTWFPEDRLPDGNVANCCFYLVDRWVGFYSRNPDYLSPNYGARVAMPVPLKP
jgi:hypothetical protein